MIYIAACVAGIFAFDENNNLIKYKLFKKDPEEIAKKLEKFERGKDFPEFQEVVKEVKGIITEQPNPATEYLKNNLRKIVTDVGFVKDQAELNQILTSVTIIRTKRKISGLERRDKLIIQTVSALNDMEKILNTMSERLRELYGLHYPELKIVDHEKFAEFVSKYGEREKFEEFEGSMGMKLKEGDIKILQNYAKRLKELYTLRKGLEKYLEKIVPKEIPNLDALLGSILAAKLLALAGSLERLAKMPSSTIQLLGAEKSLFKFLRDKGIKKPPRFGLLYLHPDISNAKRELQGKVARLLSSKLTLAARADFYTKKNISKQLVEDYKKKLKEILK